MSDERTNPMADSLPVISTKDVIAPAADDVRSTWFLVQSDDDPPAGDAPEVIPCLAAEDDLGGGDDHDDGTDLYVLKRTIGDGALLAHRLLLQPGPLGELARAIEVFLDALDAAETALMVRGHVMIGVALERIFAEALSENIDVRTRIQAVLRTGRPYEIDIEEDDDGEEGGG